MVHCSLLIVAVGLEGLVRFYFDLCAGRASATKCSDAQRGPATEFATV